MVFSLTTNVHQSSLSCGTKLYSGLELQSPSLFPTGRRNQNAEFFYRVNKCLQCGSHYNRPTRAVVRMSSVETPRVPYRAPGEGVQWLDLWNALYRERIIFVGQHMDEEFGNQILATMLYLDYVDSSKRLYFFLNCPGGDITPSMAVYDTLHGLKSPLGTVCLATARNLAAFILAAGDKGHRSAMPHSRISIQSPAGAARGQADDIHNEANELLRIRDYLYRELAKKTEQPVEKIRKDLNRPKYFDPEEALEYGIIDQIRRPPTVDAAVTSRAGPRGLG